MHQPYLGSSSLFGGSPQQYQAWQRGFPSQPHVTNWWYTNPLEKYESDWIIISNIGENKQCSKSPTSSRSFLTGLSRLSIGLDSHNIHNGLKSSPLNYLEEPPIPDALCMVYVFTSMWVILKVNVDKYSIHGAYGYYDQSTRVSVTAGYNPKHWCASGTHTHTNTQHVRKKAPSCCACIFSTLNLQEPMQVGMIHTGDYIFWWKITIW